MFGTKYDAYLKGLLKNGSPCSDLFELKAMEEVVGKIQAAAVAQPEEQKMDLADEDVDQQQGSFVGVLQSAGFESEKAKEELKTATEADLEVLDNAKIEAKRAVEQFVCIFIDDSAASGNCNNLINTLRVWPGGKTDDLSEGTYASLILYDVKQSGEDGRRPTRGAPFRRAHFEKMIRAVLRARSSTSTEEEPSVAAGDVFVVMGGIRSSPNVRNVIKGACATNMMLAYTEETIASRKERLRGCSSLQQIEHVHVFTAKGTAHLGRRPNLFFDGTTTGSCLIGVELANDDDCWKATARCAQISGSFD